MTGRQMTRRRDDPLSPLERAFQWLGGALFVSALAYCGYSFAEVWSSVPAGTAECNGRAIVIDAIIFSAFAAHHSVFAREPVKRWLMRLIPEPLLRSFYVWIASALLIAVCFAWQPIGGEIYEVRGWRAGLHAAIQLAGILVIAGAVRTIDALELAGIRPHSTRQSLQITGPYRLVRHPLYFGWLLTTFGAAHMTGDRLIFAVISAFYLVIAVPFEERSLIASFGADYTSYQRQVRWRMLPYVY
jgi:protein-S-isoprenylcysteine O-methyltransferase Ste14